MDQNMMDSKHGTFKDFLMEGYRRGRGQHETYLNVPYKLRHEAKKYGAYWDDEAKKWAIRGPIPDALKHMLPLENKKIYLNIPYKDKDEAKKYGARWDRDETKWYYEGNSLPMELEKWRNQ